MTNIKKVIGIDASNLLDGGGRTHLIEILGNINPINGKFEKIIIWGAKSTLKLIEDKPWLIKKNHWQLERNFVYRSFWQSFNLSKMAKMEKCDILLIPGGTYTGNFHPFVTMSRNMLPFSWNEIKRYKLSWMFFRLLLLRNLQIKTFRKADKLIFLSHYAKKSVLEIIGDLGSRTIVIPHGLNRIFDLKPREQKEIHQYSNTSPYRLIYVSTIDQYKHQWEVIEAIGKLRIATGWPLVLYLVGSYYSPALKKMKESIIKWDPKGDWVKYLGKIEYDQLNSFYKEADLGIFASSCENMPNILLEMMSSGLPIASSKMGPMPEVLGKDGIYFNPLDSEDIFRSLKTIIESKDLREFSADRTYARSKDFNWTKCAENTFDLIERSLIEFQNNLNR